MNPIIPVMVSVFLFILFSSTATATPFLHDPQPNNNSYTKGGTIALSINITDGTLNTSSAIVRIIELGAYQQGEEWVRQDLSCAGGPTEWKCSSNFITSTIGSDTVELFYFEANDTNGVSGNNGTASNPLRFTLDRNPSIISFVSPANNSYVAGNQTLSLTVTDSSSGVNNNTVEYSTDNSSWTKLQNTSETSFKSVWNTTTFSNNQTVTLYTRASDKVNNTARLSINVTVDNEVPSLTILSSLTGNLSGNAQLQANVSDSYSGVNLGNVKYSVDGVSGALGCTGGNYSVTCSAVLDTTRLQDGNHTLTFSVTDNAGNLNASSIEIKTKNTQPSISISEPSNAAFIRGITLIKASLVNTDGVSSVELSVEQGSNTTTPGMACNTNITSCNYSLNTTRFTDGGYTIKAKAVNNLNLDVSASITVTVDNTNPSLTITQPTADVKGDFEIKVDVIDTNLNQNKVLFNISSFNGSLTCTPQTPSRFICSTAFNSKQLNDGKYILNVTAEDKAGNLVTVSKEINIVNQQTSSSTASGGSTTGTPNETTQEKTGKEEGEKGGLFGISLPFKSKYILLGVVIGSIIVILIILAIIVSHRLGKTIITD